MKKMIVYLEKVILSDVPKIAEEECRKSELTRKGLSWNYVWIAR